MSDISDHPVVRQPEAGVMQGALERLRAMILLGELSPGVQIRQEEMAAQLGISRVPLREALNVLSDNGLLVHRRNQGYFVAKRLPAEVAQIRRMLYLLENELLHSLRAADSQVLKQLGLLNEQIAEGVRCRDLVRISTLNWAFHKTLYGLSPHDLILREVLRLWSLLDPVYIARLAQTDYLQSMVAEHQQLIELLAQNDHAGLVQAMNAHRYRDNPAPTLHG